MVDKLFALDEYEVCDTSEGFLFSGRRVDLILLTKIWESIRKTVDLRDCFVFGGLALTGYGLYLFLPWVAFSVCGAVLLAIGIFVPMGKG